MKLNVFARLANKDGVQNDKKLLFSDDHHIFADALDITQTENHSENYSLQLSIDFKIWGAGARTIDLVTVVSTDCIPGLPIAHVVITFSLPKR